MEGLTLLLCFCFNNTSLISGKREKNMDMVENLLSCNVAYFLKGFLENLFQLESWEYAWL